MVRGLILSRVPLVDMIFLVAALQGLEYTLRPPNTALVLNVIEGSIPFWAWGVWLIVPSLLGLVCNRIRMWGVAVFCHAAVAGAYFGLAVGLSAGVVNAHQTWGWQSLPAYLCFFALHGLWAVIDMFREKLT